MRRCRSGRTSRDLPVELLSLVEGFVALLERTEVDRFLVSEREDPEVDEAPVEELVNVILQVLVEVDHHVPTDDHVEVVEGPVRDEVVLSEDDVLDQGSLE